MFVRSLVLLAAACAKNSPDSGAPVPVGATSTGSTSAPTGSGSTTGLAKSGTSSTTTDSGTGTTTTSGTQICLYAAASPGYLNTYQTPYDGRVIYCHRDQNGNYHYLDTPTPDCLPHVAHTPDLFPTSLCDS